MSKPLAKHLGYHLNKTDPIPAYPEVSSLREKEALFKDLYSN